MKNITTTAAANLAHQYHDVMNMVSREERAMRRLEIGVRATLIVLIATFTIANLI